MKNPCYGKTELFFPEEPSEPKQPNTEQEMKAIAICQTCNNKLACAEKNWLEPFGINSGYTATERQQLTGRLRRKGIYLTNLPEFMRQAEILIRRKTA